MVSVYIVGDMDGMRNIISEGLIGLDCAVVAEADNVDAVNGYNQFKPDITFLDLALPGMKEMQILKKIKSINPDAYIVCYDATGDKKHALDAVMAGARYIVPVVIKFEGGRFMSNREGIRGDLIQVLDDYSKKRGAK